MKKKFDLYEALIEMGFTEGEAGNGWTELRKDYRKCFDVAWIGNTEITLTVRAAFNPSRTTVVAFYSQDGRRPFKEKVHLNDKRAFNAIRETVKNNGYEFA